MESESWSRSREDGVVKTESIFLLMAESESIFLFLVESESQPESIISKHPESNSELESILY